MAQNVVVVFPSLALLRQFYESHTEKTRPPLRECQVKALTACSQDKSVVNISMCTGAGKSRVITECLPVDGTIEYYATDGTLPDIPRISPSTSGDIILTTYISAPLVYRILSELGHPVSINVIHDEAHHITSPIYKKSYDEAVTAGLIQKSINFSATLPEGYECDYVYPLLRGIKDSVVRDFHIKAIACLAGDDEQSFVDIVNLARDWARTQGQTLRLLLYTSEANTDNDVETEGGTSVRSFLEYFASAARKNGWWMRGLHNDTMGEREEILREFEDTNPASGIAILVSCRTLSEGVDLKNVNAMLPWDPSSHTGTNTQRVGRVVRKLKNERGEYLPAEQQTPSLVVVPVWLVRDVYLEIKGDSARIHEQLYKDIENGMRGSFAPLLNVTAALKSELTLEDDELFREVINFPSKPKSGTFTGNVIEVVAKNLKKKPREVVAEMGEEGLLDDDTKASLDTWVDAPKDEKEDAWEEIPEEKHGAVLDALVGSQDLTLLIEQEKGGVPEVFGSGSIQKTLERKPDGSYAVSRRKRETPAEKKAKKEVQKRVSLCATESYRVVLGLEEGAFEDGKSLVRLTTRIEFEGENDYVWNKQFEQWKAFVEKHSRLPKAKETDDYGNNVGSWQDTQRNLYKRNKLDIKRTRMLTDESMWIWSDDTWQLYYDAARIFITKKQRLPYKNEIDSTGKKIGEWVSRQQTRKRNGHTTITKERIRLLESLPDWSWEKKDVWREGYECLKSFITKNKRIPTQKEKDENGKCVGTFASVQRKQYKKGELTDERIRLLESLPVWKWEFTPWDDGYSNLKRFIETHMRLPTQTEKDEYGNKVGIWANSQRSKHKQGKISKERVRMLESLPYWVWECTPWEDKYIAIKRFIEINRRLPTQTEKDENGIAVGMWANRQRHNYNKGIMTDERKIRLESLPYWLWDTRVYKRTKKSPKKTSDSKPFPKHIASQLETYHKKFKSMNSATYFSHIKESPSDWEEYHKIADEYDKRDAPEHSPHHRIANFIQSRGYPAGTPAIDLGCGRDRLRDDPKVSHLDWTSVDAVPASERVVQADLGSLPMSDNTYPLAIISRALWARKPDHMTQLAEAHRVLQQGGTLVLCESRRKWVEEIVEDTESGNPRTTTVNHLENAVRDAGVVITARSKDDDKSVWQFLVCQKPMVGGI